MSKIQINDLTIKKIESEEFKKELPEIYSLQNNLENNPWHKNQTTFFHTLLVLKALEKNFKKYKNLREYLNEKIDKNTKRNILFLATLFHDIAKPQTVTIKNNQTFFPQHEEQGAKITKIILERFNLTNKAKQLIISTVLNHSFFHDFLFNNEKINKAKKKHRDIFPELLIFGLSDTEGCNLKELIPEEFEKRRKQYLREITKIKAIEKKE